MPQFVKRFSDLKGIGPIIDVTLYPAAEVVTKYNLDKGERIPSKPCVALIDTGASMSAIDTPLVDELNLISRDLISVQTPAGISNHYTYDVGIQLPKEMGFKTFFIEVTGSILTHQPYDILIGRDILQNCTLIFNGWDNSFQLHI